MTDIDAPSTTPPAIPPATHRRPAPLPRDDIAPDAGGPPAGYRRAFDTVGTVLLFAFIAAVLVQVFLAGAGAFHRHGAGGPGFGPHEVLGNALGIAGVVILVVVLIAHVSWRMMVGTFVMALLTEVAQHGLAQFGWKHQWLGATHALDGIVILLLACALAVASARRIRGGRLRG